MPFEIRAIDDSCVASLDAALRAVDTRSDGVHPTMAFVADRVGRDADRDDTVDAVVRWPTDEPLLSDVARDFEHFGLRVADRSPLGTTGTAVGAAYYFSFKTTARPTAAALSSVAQAFEAQSVHDFQVDSYARLIALTDLAWRDIELVRAASRFVRQAELRLSEQYVIRTLIDHPDFVTAFITYFRTRFDPSTADRQDAVRKAHASLLDRVSASVSVDEDRIMRSFESFASGCVRTNWYQPGVDGAPKRVASFKLISTQIDSNSSIAPYREIYVYGHDIEGIHARGGPVARGGLRFSDRPEDYRTEVLGLMKTQSVKNAPIVPVGAKGAFVRKNSSVTAPEAYAMFVRGLLDVTDNLVDGLPAFPPHTVGYDEPDTYLVVAADKGTATFSDLANSVAAEYEFWLGDAFASGGSHGYDHKDMGITARGAWVAVAHHFESIGIDVSHDTVRVVGIGDMSGDVFGNAMLLSSSMKLVAAFDHRHIFLDPDPHPADSLRERTRLAAQTGSTWADYDRGVISSGGGVFARTSKRIDLSPEVRNALSIGATSLPPDRLIQAILSAPVDLLFNGGIGTYVKSSTESHSDAADPANDAVRINASDLSCRVIGEGGNLGLTQRARIDFALAGGRVNADFVDNAAGVATSDLEVNLKMVLDSAVRTGRITPQQRDLALAEAAPQVAQAVLANSRSQNVAISVAEALALPHLSRHEHLIENFESVNGIIRTTQVLPTQIELRRRAQSGFGLTRPEIAILLAQSKNIVRQDLLDSSVLDEPLLATYLPTYFPATIRAGFSGEIADHRLARELIATRVSDDLINHLGPGLIHRIEERLGVETVGVARAYVFVRDVFDVDALWNGARDRTGLAPDERWSLLGKIQSFIEHASAWVLQNTPEESITVAETQHYRSRLTELVGDTSETDRLVIPGHLQLLSDALPLIRTADRTGRPIVAVNQLHTRVGQMLDLGWLMDRVSFHSSPDWWDSMAYAALRDDLSSRHHRLVEIVADLAQGDDDPVETWRRCIPAHIDRFTALTADLRRDAIVDLSRLCTVNHELALLNRAARLTLKSRASRSSCVGSGLRDRVHR